jgi:LacI family transcriptional regulator
MHAARKRGLSLPDDLSVMGFDDIPLATYSLPALTSIAQPIHGIGKQTAELLLARLQDPKRPPVTRISEAQLVVRDSTQPPDEDK